MPPRPQEGYGRPHAGSAGRLSPAGHPSGGHHNTHSGVMSPPPTGGPKPTHHNRPPPNSRPPPSPAPTDGGADPTLLPLFRAVDKDGTYHTPSTGSGEPRREARREPKRKGKERNANTAPTLTGTGQLSERELSAALVNGDWTAFDPHTVRMMIRMFDSDRSGTIGFEEFCGLWSFLASWRTLFDRFDADKSGNIQLDEFNNALVAFRYRLSERFVELLFQTYDKRNEGVLSFDLFVQACISLKRMTDVFKKYDDDRDGYITLSFEDFLTEILRQLK